MMNINNALIVTASEKKRDEIRKIVAATGAGLNFAANGGEARRLLSSCDYNIVVVYAPLLDEFGDELCVFVAQTTLSGIILIVKSNVADEISAKVEMFGVFVMPAPIIRAHFIQILRLAEASRRRLTALRDENAKLKIKIEQIKIADKAKYVLIKNFGMTEAQAHRYIEKQAMDMRISKTEVAESILKIYEY